VTLVRWAFLVLVALAGTSAAGAQSFERGRLFRVDRVGLAPSFVLATLHTSDQRVLALPAPVLAALDECRTAAFETLLADGDAGAFAEAARDTGGRRLSDDLDATAWSALRDALGEDAPEPAALDAMKPWAALLLLAQSRPGGGLALDGMLKARAAARKLSVIGLELPDEQVAALDAVPRDSQLALLAWAVATRDARARELEATTQAWLAGDLARLRALALHPPSARPADRAHFAALYRRLITDRNATMAHRLHLPLLRGRVFVAVGALHLHGRDGLLALIRRQGYRVSRVL
jgi:uncharacterized protein YbaP (TraB family)